MEPVDIRSVDGAVVGSTALDDAFFGVTPNVPLMHQVVTAQLAAARRGTQSTLTRAEVSGGGAKPFRQKGTGRARAGSSRSPNWTGGGVALGPKPRSYRQKTPKKMIRGALLSALSDRAAGGKIIVVREWPWTAPSTREARLALEALETVGRVVIVVAADDEITIKSFRNLPEVHLLSTNELNAYDVLCSDWLIFTEATLPGTHVDTAPVRVAKGARSATSTTTAEVTDDGGSDASGTAGEAVAAAGFDPFIEPEPGDRSDRSGHTELEEKS